MNLLIELYTMYINGELASEYDKASNKMVNSQKVVAIMEKIKDSLPEKLSPLQAAKNMRELEAEKREEAIKEANQAVIDMRKAFQHKMSQNGGALGLTKSLVDASNRGDVEAVKRILSIMEKLVKADA